MKFQMSESMAKRIFVILFSIISLVMIVSAFDFPTNGDELEHIANGKANVKFYTSLGKDTSYLNPPAPYQKGADKSLMRYYGVFTDITAEAFCGVFTKLGIDFMDARHIYNVLLGLLGAFFTALTARLFAKSWWAASIALAIIMATPPFTGFTYNLSKDIPLATGFIIALYAIYYLSLNILQPLNKKILAILALGVCIAIGNRVSGVLIYAYAGLFLCIAVYRQRQSMTTRDIRMKVLWVCGTLLVGHIAGLLFWPYGLVSPVNHFKETFDVVSKFPLKMSTFFEGENMDINEPLWYFIPKYILITTPLIFIVGLLLSLFVPAFKTVTTRQYLPVVFMLLFPGLFPILYVIYSKAVVLQCWRHFLFVYPPLVVLAALGWYYLLNNRKRIYAGIVFVVLFFMPVIWMVQNHPYEYSYFNELAGGMRGANNNYELDSYCFGVKNCFKWIADNNDIKKDSLIINCNEDDAPIYYSRKYFKQPVKNVIGGFRSRHSKDWDYGVYSTLFLSKEEREKFYPPENYELVHAEYVDKDIPVYIVLKRKGRLDFDGMQAYDAGNLPLADSLLSAYNEQTKYDCNVPVMLAMLSRINMKRFTDAASLYNTALNKGKTTLEMDFYGAVAYANAGDLNRAKTILTGAIDNGLQDPNANKLLMQINQLLNSNGGGASPGI